MPSIHQKILNSEEFVIFNRENGIPSFHDCQGWTNLPIRALCFGARDFICAPDRALKKAGAQNKSQCAR